MISQVVYVVIDKFINIDMIILITMQNKVNKKMIAHLFVHDCYVGHDRQSANECNKWAQLSQIYGRQ